MKNVVKFPRQKSAIDAVKPKNITDYEINLMRKYDASKNYMRSLKELNAPKDQLAREKGYQEGLKMALRAFKQVAVVWVIVVPTIAQAGWFSHKEPYDSDAVENVIQEQATVDYIRAHKSQPVGFYDRRLYDAAPKQYASNKQYIFDRPAEGNLHSDQWYRDHMPKFVKLTPEEERRVYAGKR